MAYHRRRSSFKRFTPRRPFRRFVRRFSSRRGGSVKKMYYGRGLVPVARYPSSAAAYAGPRVQWLNFKYCTSGVSVAPAANFSLQQMRLNSLFDPDLTGAGHQPYCFDQYSALYASYCVTKCTVRIKAIMTSAQGNTTKAASLLQAANIGMFWSNGTASLTTNAYSFMEQPGCVSTLVTMNAPVTLKKTFYLPTYSGQTTIAYLADALNQSATTNNPGRNMYLNFVISGADPATDAPSVHFQIVMDYKAKMFDPIGQPSS